MSKYVKTLIFTSLFSIASGYAQNANEVKRGGLLIPKIKVDGKAEDWNPPLKAFNKSTGLHYSLANDDKNFYLIIQAGDINTTRKILMGGVTLSLNADGKKKSKELLHLTYPVITRNSRRSAMSGGGQRSGSSQTMTPEQRDSLQHAFGQRQLASAKDISIFGFKNVSDTLVSIYNEYSIKAVANLDSKGVYTYEIGIPLELLPVELNKEFGYNIKVNGLELRSAGGGSSNNSNRGGSANRPSGGSSGNRPTPPSSSGGRGSVDIQDLMTPTDFWGKYTLVK